MHLSPFPGPSSPRLHSPPQPGALWGARLGLPRDSGSSHQAPDGIFPKLLPHSRCREHRQVQGPGGGSRPSLGVAELRARLPVVSIRWKTEPAFPRGGARAACSGQSCSGTDPARDCRGSRTRLQRGQSGRTSPSLPAAAHSGQDQPGGTLPGVGGAARAPRTHLCFTTPLPGH